MMNDMTPRDRALAEAVRRTLDDASARPDPLLDAALAATRAQAAGLRSRHRPPVWMVAAGSLALAASVAVIVVMPHLASSPVPAVTPVTAEAMAVPAEDPQFLEDMDMLSVLGDDSRES
jgi:hypothetical protein